MIAAKASRNTELGFMLLQYSKTFDSPRYIHQISLFTALLSLSLSIYIYMLPYWVEHFSGEFSGYCISWNAIALLKNWAHSVAVNVYKKKSKEKSLQKRKNYDGSGVRYPTDVKSAGFRSQLEATHVSSHNEESWYNEPVCMWMTIYMRVWICACKTVGLSK